MIKITSKNCSKKVNERVGKQKAHTNVHDNYVHDHRHHKECEDRNLHWIPLFNYLAQEGDIIIRAMGSTLFISCVPIVLLFFVFLDNISKQEFLIETLLGFATGSLFCDTILDLTSNAFPHILNSQNFDDSDHEDHRHLDKHGMFEFLYITAVIFTCLLFEHKCKEMNGTSNNKKERGSNDEKSEKKQPGYIKIAGYWNLSAHILHNFKHGLLIGASYLAGNSLGCITSLIILLHKIPNEMGDFAIHIPSGRSKPMAIILQLVTVVGALLGTYTSFLADGICGLTIKRVQSKLQWSVVHMIVKILEESKNFVKIYNNL